MSISTRVGLLAATAAGSIAVVALAIPVVSSSAVGSVDAPKPTVVLVHGAWADSSSWSSVARRLQSDGYTVDVSANPLRGLTSDSAYLADYLSTISGPIVLVGHSYGGAVITNAARGNANVKALVYVDAFIPDSDQTVLGLVGAHPGSHLADVAAVFNLVPYPGAPAGDSDLYVKPSVFRDALAGDTSRNAAAVLAATQRPITFSALTDKSGPPAWKTIPSWAVVGTADNAIPLAGQLDMAKHAGAHITEIDAPHLSMIAHPEAIEKVIQHAARAASSR